MMARVALYLTSFMSVLLIGVNILSLIGDEVSDLLSILDFPKLQFFWAGVLLMALLIVLRNQNIGSFKSMILILLAATTFLQGLTLKNYTPFVGESVSTYLDQQGSHASFKLMIANVQMSNRRFKQFVRLVEEESPDILLVMEANGNWIAQLSPVSRHYIYKKEFPLDNTYGIALYSSLKLENVEVEFLFREDVPSIHATIVLPDGRRLRFHGTHPVPPVPSEYPDSFGKKEMELLLIGDIVASDSLPSIVAGDFNDVAWSNLTTLFAARGKLKDVRVGRGFYNSFSAKSIVTRWPLDHVFVTEEFQVLNLKRSKFYGSDHFAFIACLQMK